MHKFGPLANILQVHVPTAAASMTVAGLTRHIEALAETLADGRALEPADRIFLGYDAVQSMPVEPTTVHEAGPALRTEEPPEADAADDAALSVDPR